MLKSAKFIVKKHKNYKILKINNKVFSDSAITGRFHNIYIKELDKLAKNSYLFYKSKPIPDIS